MMTLDFTNFAGEFTMYKSDVTTVANRLYLKSRYDNEYILNGADLWLFNDFIPLSLDAETDRWVRYTWLFTNPDLQNKDIGGYYIAEFARDATRIPQLNPLVKVNNLFTTTNDNVVHISDNESNEQYTLFR